MAFDIIILLVLILLNGFFALSEMAIVSSKGQRLRALIDEARGGSDTSRLAGLEAAYELNQNPSDILSAVQIWITMIGVLAGAFGGATVAADLADHLSTLPEAGYYAAPAAFVFVVVAITFLTLVIGELVPKRYALSDPELLAGRIARPLIAVTRLLAPAVNLVSWSTDITLKVLGIQGDRVSSVTEEEIRHLVEEGFQTGAIEGAERDIVNRVFEMDTRKVTEYMTPRSRLVWLDYDAPIEENLELIREQEQLRYPVRSGQSGEVVGMVRMEDLFFGFEGGTKDQLFGRMSKPVYIPANASVLTTLGILQAEQVFMGLVIDEYGEVQGVISMREIFTAIVGDATYKAQVINEAIVEREDGSYLIDGMVSTAEIKSLLNLPKLPGEEAGNYNTIAGLMLDWFERLPNAGEYFSWNGYRFEIADLDGPRIDKVLVVPAPNLPIGKVFGVAEAAD